MKTKYYLFITLTSLYYSVTLASQGVHHATLSIKIPQTVTPDFDDSIEFSDDHDNFIASQRGYLNDIIKKQIKSPTIKRLALEYTKELKIKYFLYNRQLELLGDLMGEIYQPKKYPTITSSDEKRIWHALYQEKKDLNGDLQELSSYLKLIAQEEKIKIIQKTEQLVKSNTTPEMYQWFKKLVECYDFQDGIRIFSSSKKKPIAPSLLQELQNKYELFVLSQEGIDLSNDSIFLSKTKKQYNDY